MWTMQLILLWQMYETTYAFPLGRIGELNKILTITGKKGKQKSSAISDGLLKCSLSFGNFFTLTRAKLNVY